MSRFWTNIYRHWTKYFLSIRDAHIYNVPTLNQIIVVPRSKAKYLQLKQW
jgi:hypothetical protein